jgi:bifunctional non-homologous end joining protein LigD
VVQEHHARRLHWDLRLERDGVAASWAVPNGIPQLPGENRKAVHTEDHPLKYLDWEGEIPEGEYGAGTMKVWDRGVYECHEWTGDKVTATFHGERLAGRYHLFQAGRGESDWMIRRVDPPADPEREPLPDHVSPVDPGPGKLPRNDRGWAFEVDWPGVRAVAYLEPGRIRVESHGEDLSELFPELRGLTRDLGMRPAVLDGVITVFGDDGRPVRDALERRLRPGSPSAAKRRARSTPATYVIFDVLHLDGHDLRALAYGERRELLESLALEGLWGRAPAAHIGDGRAFLEAARAQGLERIVAKRLDRPFEWVAVRAG